jgi:cysteine-rich repeat protein
MEEINFEPAGFAGGGNYGWRCMEGTACTGLTGCTCNAANLTLPIHTYTHASLPAGAVSETGGYVYRGCAMPSLHGRYFYGDYGQDFIKSFKYTTGGGAVDHQDHTTALNNIIAPVSFGEDNAGELYVVSYIGNIYRIVEQTGPVCGNGTVEAGEECDDNNNTPGDGCFNCQFEPGNNDNCSGATVVCAGQFTDTLVGATNDGSSAWRRRR